MHVVQLVGVAFFSAKIQSPTPKHQRIQNLLHPDDKGCTDNPVSLSVFVNDLNKATCSSSFWADMLLKLHTTIINVSVYSANQIHSIRHI